MHQQAQAQAATTQGELVPKDGAPAAPAQLAFSTWRVNDYDLHIQHNEAVELACQHLGLTRTRTDPFFDGTRGTMLAKIIPLNHPLTPLDLEALRTELKNRPEEERDVLVVSLGQEHAARAWVEHYNHNRPINKIHLIELRTDRKAGALSSTNRCRCRPTWGATMTGWWCRLMMWFHPASLRGWICKRAFFGRRFPTGGRWWIAS